ncbi:MAG: SBBP repeat-containing protein [Trueperaceae bacterium]|nr:SBBP repeat-containing protein [Trueperaceae bacterium]
MRPTVVRLATITALALATTLTACAPSGTIAGITSVTINGGDRTLTTGDTTTLTATVVATGGASQTITWTSSNPSVATIDTSGNVLALTEGTTTITATSTTDPTKNDTITLTVDAPGMLRWTRQFGTDNSDEAAGIATDPIGNVYIVGYTSGALTGSNAGSDDGFIRSYDQHGNHRWTRQFGTTSSDRAYGVATDTNGNVYTVGNTFGALEGSNAGSVDVFIRAYDQNGNHRWTRQFGTSSYDLATGIATDTNGNVYTSGYTNGALEGSNVGGFDAFIRSYDQDGNHRWTRQFGTSSGDIATGIASDTNGNVYTSGYTNGALEGSNAGNADAFIRSYDQNGNHRWTRQFGTISFDFVNGIASDTNGNVYTAGRTNGALEGSSAGSDDAFIRSYDQDGNHRWTRQFGTSSNDYSTGVASDTNGNVYAAGRTDGDLEDSNAGGGYAFIRAYNQDGNHRWTRQFGTSSNDYSTGVASDTNGNVYAAGYTNRDLDGSNAGDNDAFIRSHGR